MSRGLGDVYKRQVFPLASFLVCVRMLGVLGKDVKKLFIKGEEGGNAA